MNVKDVVREYLDKYGNFFEKPLFYLLLFLFSVVLSLLDFPVGDVAQAGLLFFAVYALFFTKEQLIEWRRKEVIKHCDIAFLEAEKIKDDVHVIIT